MQEEKQIEALTCLEDMSELMQKLMLFSKDLVKEFSETGLLTVEDKKDYDNLVFECENCIKQAELLIDSNELPM